MQGCMSERFRTNRVVCGILTRLLEPERVTGFDRQTVLLLHLGYNHPIQPLEHSSA